MNPIAMNPIARNVLAVICGLGLGSVVNIGLVTIGPFVVPIPEGADVSTMASVRASMKLFTPVHFIVPFLAHALGTLTGAFVAAKLADRHPVRFAVGIGAAFLLGGVTAVSMLGGPMWFNVADLLLAYIPMGLLGGILAGGKRPPNA